MKDARFLSRPQRRPVAGEQDGSDRQASTEIDEAPVAPLTPWATAQIASLQQGLQDLVYRTTLAVEIYQVQRAELDQRLAIAQQQAQTAREKAQRLAATGPGEAVATGPGEVQDSAAVLAARRVREHQQRLAAHHGQAESAERMSAQLQERIATVTRQVNGAWAACSQRQEELVKLTSRRLSLYAGGISTKHPEAAVVAALTHQLVLTRVQPLPDPDRPRPHGGVI